MTPFAFLYDRKRPGRTRQGFAITIAALRAPLTEPARPRKRPERKAKGVSDDGFRREVSHYRWIIRRGKASTTGHGEFRDSE
jgi:hypothetical protein